MCHPLFHFGTDAFAILRKLFSQLSYTAAGVSNGPHAHQVFQQKFHLYHVSGGGHEVAQQCYLVRPKMFPLEVAKNRKQLIQIVAKPSVSMLCLTILFITINKYCKNEVFEASFEPTVGGQRILDVSSGEKSPKLVTLENNAFHVFVTFRPLILFTGEGFTKTVGYCFGKAHGWHFLKRAKKVFKFGTLR